MAAEVNEGQGWAGSAEPSTALTSAIQDELAARFRPYLSLFGSVAAVSAFLLYAGFLSDFGAYRLAGLPRLSFSFTALVETGADVAVDMLSLLAQGTRAFWLVVLLAAVVIVWSHHRSRVLRPLAKSCRLYRLSRIALLGIAFVVFASLVDRTQRSLSGEMHTSAAVERGLTEAYAASFPDPYQRQRALDKQGYELRFFRIPNWTAGVEADWRWVKEKIAGVQSDRLDEEEGGIVLRNLPESRRDARHVFGWLALTVLALVLAAALCQWWARDLEHIDVPRRRRAHALIRWLDADLAAPIDRLVVPLTMLMLAMSILLLPLAHGVLAKKSLGGEHVMVYLKERDATKTDQSGYTTEDRSTPTNRVALRPSLHPPSALSWPTARLDCTGDVTGRLHMHVGTYNEALRDFVQERKADEDYEKAFRTYLAQLDELAQAVIESNCADAVRSFLASRPTPGLAAVAPEIAESYRRIAARVATAYDVRVGTILTYPRDSQPLTLVDGIVPRSTLQSPTWSLQAIDAQTVADSVVLPDLYRRGMQRVANILQSEPDHDAIAELLVAPTSEALEVILPLLRDNRLYANGRGVSVTSLGGMALTSAAEKPQLTRDAVDLLADLTGSKQTAFWPQKDARVRGGAVTALHLTRSPYAGYQLAQQVSAAGPATCASTAPETLPSIACVPQSSTAAGYLLQDLAEEARHFSTPARVPHSLQKAREQLEAFISQLITTTAVAEDVRGAACSAIGLAGGIKIADPALRKVYLDGLEVTRLQEHPFSAGACLLHSHRVGIEATQLRPMLRKVARTVEIPGFSPPESTAMRMAALKALTDLGLSGEVEAIGGLYLSEPANSDLAEAVRSVLVEVDGPQISKFLLTCGSAQGHPESGRTKCLEGFAHTHGNVDGDDGTASAVIEIARSNSGDLRRAACTAVRAFRDRSGRIVLRLLKAKDPTVVACLQDDAGRDDQRSQAERMRRLLELLSERSTSKVPRR